MKSAIQALPQILLHYTFDVFFNTYLNIPIELLAFQYFCIKRAKTKLVHDCMFTIKCIEQYGHRPTCKVQEKNKFIA